jgi:hypothetical protein
MNVRLDTKTERFNDYKLKKKLESSPGLVYDVKDSRELSYTEKYRHMNVTIIFSKSPFSISIQTFHS